MDRPPGSRLFVVCGHACSESTLRRACSQYGTVEHIKMLRDKGVAYVKFPTASEAARAQENLHLTTLRDGRVPVQLKVLVADPPDKLHQQDRQDGQLCKNADPDNTPPRSRLFIVVPRDTDPVAVEEELCKFEGFDYVKSDLAQSKGVIYAKFKLTSCALRALEDIQSNNSMLAGKRVKVLIAEPRTSSRESHSTDRHALSGTPTELRIDSRYSSLSGQSVQNGFSDNFFDTCPAFRQWCTNSGALQALYSLWLKACQDSQLHLQTLDDLLACLQQYNDVSRVPTTNAAARYNLPSAGSRIPSAFDPVHIDHPLSTNPSFPDPALLSSLPAGYTTSPASTPLNPASNAASNSIHAHLLSVVGPEGAASGGPLAPPLLPQMRSPSSVFTHAGPPGAASLPAAEQRGLASLATGGALGSGALSLHSADDGQWSRHDSAVLSRGLSVASNLQPLAAAAGGFGSTGTNVSAPPGLGGGSASSGVPPHVWLATGGNAGVWDTQAMDSRSVGGSGALGAGAGGHGSGGSGLNAGGFGAGHGAAAVTSLPVGFSVSGRGSQSLLLQLVTAPVVDMQLFDNCVKATLSQFEGLEKCVGVAGPDVQLVVWYFCHFCTSKHADDAKRICSMMDLRLPGAAIVNVHYVTLDASLTDTPAKSSARAAHSQSADGSGSLSFYPNGHDNGLVRGECVEESRLSSVQLSEGKHVMQHSTSRSSTGSLAKTEMAVGSRGPSCNSQQSSNSQGSDGCEAATASGDDDGLPKPAPDVVYFHVSRDKMPWYALDWLFKQYGAIRKIVTHHANDRFGAVVFADAAGAQHLHAKGNTIEFLGTTVICSLTKMHPESSK